MMVMLLKDEYGEWHETETSVKLRIEDALGFRAEETKLMESSEKHGITETVSFTHMGRGWYFNFETEEVGRAREWDE